MSNCKKRLVFQQIKSDHTDTFLWNEMKYYRMMRMLGCYICHHYKHWQMKMISPFCFCFSQSRESIIQLFPSQNLFSTFFHCFLFFCMFPTLRYPSDVQSSVFSSKFIAVSCLYSSQGYDNFLILFSPLVFQLI